MGPRNRRRPRRRLDDLLRAYPEQPARLRRHHLIWRDGTRMAVDDGRPDKTMEEQMRDGSILDQLRLSYPAGAPLPPAREDPGRVRNRALFDKMYGDCTQGEVSPKLVPRRLAADTWGHTMSITSVNGVDRQLAAVSRELDDAARRATRSTSIRSAAPTRAGRRRYRPDQHARLGSGDRHQHGLSDYWLWRHAAGGTAAYANRIPPEIVEIFERHGFIWGGRWAHFDTMHFEYRPELLQPPTEVTSAPKR